MTDAAIRPFCPADASWVIARHGALYAQEAGFDASFQSTVSQIVQEFVQDHDPVCERGWIAEGQGQRLGSVFCVRLGPDAAKLRLFLVEPRSRGTGLGRALLETCLAFARDAGYARLRLWTHESHRAACSLYRARGFTCLSSRPITNYGRPLVEQSWEIAL